MSELEEKLAQLMSDPKTMEQISSLAQNLGIKQTDTSNSPISAFNEIDPKMLNQLAGIAGQSGIDSNQKSLLNALTPYLSKQRISKLERAMRAAKMARLASGFLPTLTGR